jgi:quercetin dioxygenase-like cupin family protein
MVPEARLEQLDTGLAPVTDGWFVVNVASAAWVTNPEGGDACIFESDDVTFPHVGFTLNVIRPGQVPGRYHREANQENFLVLSGECLMIIEGVERRLQAWDFVHCPPDCEHVFIGAGDGPCVIFATGARNGWPDDKGIVYTPNEIAARHGASVGAETTVSAEAYAGRPPWRPGHGPLVEQLF